jgi:hypothetical protein
MFHDIKEKEIIVGLLAQRFLWYLLHIDRITNLLGSRGTSRYREAYRLIKNPIDGTNLSIGTIFM